MKTYIKPKTYTGQIAAYFLGSVLMARLKDEEKFAAKLIKDFILYSNLID